MAFFSASFSFTIRSSSYENGTQSGCKGSDMATVREVEVVGDVHMSYSNMANTIL